MMSYWRIPIKASIIDSTHSVPFRTCMHCMQGAMFILAAAIAAKCRASAPFSHTSLFERNAIHLLFKDSEPFPVCRDLEPFSVCINSILSRYEGNPSHFLFVETPYYHCLRKARAILYLNESHTVTLWRKSQSFPVWAPPYSNPAKEPLPRPLAPNVKAFQRTNYGKTHTMLTQTRLPPTLARTEVHTNTVWRQSIQTLFEAIPRQFPYKVCLSEFQ